MSDVICNSVVVSEEEFESLYMKGFVGISEDVDTIFHEDGGILAGRVSGVTTDDNWEITHKGFFIIRNAT